MESESDACSEFPSISYPLRVSVLTLLQSCKLFHVIHIMTVSKTWIIIGNFTPLQNIHNKIVRDYLWMRVWAKYYER